LGKVTQNYTVVLGVVIARDARSVSVQFTKHPSVLTV